MHCYSAAFIIVLLHSIHQCDGLIFMHTENMQLSITFTSLFFEETVQHLEKKEEESSFVVALAVLDI